MSYRLNGKCGMGHVLTYVPAPSVGEGWVQPACKNGDKCDSSAKLIPFKPGKPPVFPRRADA